MGNKTNIEWSDSTWNPTYGCDKVSAGCKNCYAIRDVYRIQSALPHKYGSLVQASSTGQLNWTGKILMLPEKLTVPLRWQDPRRIFVNSLSDVFHENIPFGYIAQIFAVMGNAQRHIFQVLTKRPEVAKEWFSTMSEDQVKTIAKQLGLSTDFEWPLPNVWLGVSTENEETALERIPKILECPAAVHWISAEPLLGPIPEEAIPDGLKWAVVGGESGPKARKLDSAWVESLYRTCKNKNIGFMFKQWGKLSSNPDLEDPTAKENGGKTKGGRTFRGKLWDEGPAQIGL